jgi:DNA-binding transcriptional LysR family regulator
MDIIGKDLNLLKIFLTLAEEKQLSRAAKRLNLSQPALSYQLKRMKHEFEDDLFVRTRKGYSLTTRAEQILPGIRSTLESAERLYINPQFKLEKYKKKFVLASTGYFEIIVIEKLLGLLGKEAPLVTLKTVALNDDLPEKELDSGECSIAVAAFFKEIPKSFYVKTIGQDRQVCVMRKGHPYLKGPQNLAAYLQCDHIKISIPINSVSRIDKYLKDQGLGTRKIVADFNNFLTPALVLQETDSILTVPEKLAKIYAKKFGLEVCPVPVPSITLETKMVWHERSQHDPFHKWMRAEIEKIYTST